MNISIHTEETGNSIVKIKGDLVASNVDQLAEAVNGLKPSGDMRVFMDLGEIAFMDSFGLRTFMQIQNNLRKKGGELVCYNVPAKLHKVFKITGADQKILLINNTTGTRQKFPPGRKRKHFTLTLAPLFEEVDLVRHLTEELCRNFYHKKVAESEISDFIMAVTEATNNVVEHSKASLVEVEIKAEPDRIFFIIKNDGIKFDPTEELAKMPEVNDDNLPEGGFGQAIIVQLMDRVHYEFIDNRNILTLIKKVNRQ